MKRLISAYLPGYTKAIIYMLQSTEYQVKPYLAWYKRTRSFVSINKRRNLDLTKAARLLLIAIRLGILFQLVAGVLIMIYGFSGEYKFWAVLFGLTLILTYPFVWARLITVPLTMGRLLIVQPKEKRLIAESAAIFNSHPGVTIGIAGSYGKTTVKELLGTVLGAYRRVAVTPANKNVAISHAYFARKLTGDEEILVIEYGEGQPGDVARFSKTTQPDIGIITGIAPAHLDQYPSLAAAEADIFSLATYLQVKPVYVNGESPVSATWQNDHYKKYSRSGVDDLEVSDISVGFDGTRFTATQGSVRLSLYSQLVGRHMVGPLSLVVKLGLDLGMKPEEVQSAVALTKPFEHRMQPRSIAGGWIIDDTYNGNLEGIRAGLALLSELPATRKIYVTPGLVDQGNEVERVHNEIAELIDEVSPTKVVLMQNSATEIIAKRLEALKFNGEVVIEPNPLEFYTNIEHFMASGDVVMMQNDWTDNYA